MPIVFAELQKEFEVVRITGNDKVKNHLANLGFIPGEKVMLVNRVNDACIVKVKGVSLAISIELAKRIII